MEAAQLRPYQSADLAALHELDQVCFPPGIAYSLAELQAFLEHPSSFARVASSEEKIAGFAIVRPMRRAAAGSVLPVPVLHLLTIDVAPAFRRQGVGALLMNWAFEQAEALRSRAVVLEVAVDNEPAQHFYRRFGFVYTRTLPGYYGGELDAFELERDCGS